MTRDRVTYDANWRGRAFTLVDTGGWVARAQGLAAQVAEQASDRGRPRRRGALRGGRAGRRHRRGRGGRERAAPRGQAGRAGGQQGGRRQERGGRALAVVARPGRAGHGLRHARPGQRRHARPGPRGAAGGAAGAAGRGGPAPGGADRQAQRRQVLAAQQAGGRAAGGGRLGRGHHPRPGRRADRARRDDLAVRGHGRDQEAVQGQPGRRLLRDAAHPGRARPGRGRGRADRRERAADRAGPADPHDGGRGRAARSSSPTTSGTWPTRSAATTWSGRSSGSSTTSAGRPG